MSNAQRIVQEAGQKQKTLPQQVMTSRLLQLPIDQFEQMVRYMVYYNYALEPFDIDHSPIREDISTRESDIEKEPRTREGDEPEGGSDEEGTTTEEGTTEGVAISGLGKEDEDDSEGQSDSDSPNKGFYEPEQEVGITFADSLKAQFALKPITERQRQIAQVLIDSIDDSGYIRESTEELIADLFSISNLDATPEEVEEVIRIIQELDPAGVGARDLKECLLIQLNRSDETSPALSCAKEIVKYHFDDFKDFNIEKVRPKINADGETLQSAMLLIRTLNPKPGPGNSDNIMPSIAPDFIVHSEGNKLYLDLAESNLPEFKFNEDYSKMLATLSKQKSRTAEEDHTLSFIREHTDNANWLISAIPQREKTLANVMKAVLKRQRQFFLSGDADDLVPMLQKDIAADTGLDETTISRVVNEKYVETDFGTFLLQKAFVKGFPMGDGDAIAVTKIQSALQEIVDSEDPQHPYSDENLSQLLKAKGYDVKRRTVAKYRDQLGIGSSSERKKK